MDDAKEQAKEQFARLRGSMQPRVDSVQSRLRQVPDRLQNIPDQLQKLPERIPRNFPRPSSPRGHGRSNSWGSSGGRSPSPPRESLIAPPLLRAPALSDPTYDSSLATLASKILYRSGECPVSGGPLMVLCASAFPDANVIDYTVLLPYVLSNLPGDDELNGSVDGGSAGGYSVVFFAGGGDKKSEQGGRPTWKWTLQAYTLLGRAVRKKIQRLWVVHEKSWIRTILEIMAGVVSVKFKKKIVHLATLSDLAIHVDITKLNIPPSVYLYDRKLSNKIVVPGFPPEPVFGREPFRVSANPPRVGDNTPLPQVLVDTSTYIRQSCLHVQGLFRVPPSQALLECARDCYDRKTSLVWDNWGPHIAAGLIKLYYRSLPRPMIPMEHYEQMQSLVATDPDPTRRPTEEEEKEVRFEVVRSLLTAETAGLPEYSRILFLRHLLPLLADISVHSAENKMDSTNLAVCVAGSLARSDDVAADARASAGIRKFVEIGIERIEELAPKLPLRRGLADAGHRRSQVSLVSLESGGPARQPIARKLVPSLTMPRWENQGKETAIQRKPL
ncbi:Rho GTPase activation protein, partial [Wilcoxina mikolae CBS 423.85]